MKFAKIVSFLIASSICFTLRAQTLPVRGFIRDSESQKPIIKASILNQTRQKKYISNEYGAFTIQAQAGDTIVLSSIAYQTKKIMISKDSLNQILHWTLLPIPYQLKTFSYKEIRTDSLAIFYSNVFKTDPLLNNFITYTKRPRGAPLKHMPLMMVMGGCYGCILTLWENFSDRGKELKKFDRIYALYQIQMKADDKFNLDWFKRISQLDESESKQFFRSCRPSNDYILNHNEYDIAVFVRNCLQKQDGLRR